MSEGGQLVRDAFTEVMSARQDAQRRYAEEPIFHESLTRHEHVIAGVADTLLGLGATRAMVYAMAAAELRKHIESAEELRRMLAVLTEERRLHWPPLNGPVPIAEGRRGW